jgi:hypothetical protein
MLLFQRRNGRKVLKLARLLAALDEQARSVRPAPSRAGRASFNA